MDEATDKQRLRAAARELRASAQAGDLEGKAAQQVVVHFTTVFSGHAGLGRNAVVAGYWPLGSEMDVRPLMIQLAAAGAAIVLPVMRGVDQALEFRRWRSGDALLPGAHGVMQPLPEAPLAVPTVVLVPLLAFDGDGWRLGYGAGYYDRTLKQLRARASAIAPLVVGIAYAAQEMSALPHHAGDQRLDGVVTELAARRFG